MKAYFYLGQAQLAIKDFDAALANVLRAHELCVSNNDKSLAAVTTVVLRCKKERWDDLERRRIRESQDLEREMLELLAKDRNEMLAAVTDDDEIERRTIEEDSEKKMARMRDIFERARTESEKRREVPEWAIDDISFGIMVDPVIVSHKASFTLLPTWNPRTNTEPPCRPRRASLTSEPPSWSICDDTPAIPSPASRSSRPTCARTLVLRRHAPSSSSRTVGPSTGSSRQPARRASLFTLPCSSRVFASDTFSATPQHEALTDIGILTIAIMAYQELELDVLYITTLYHPLVRIGAGV
jgi:STIP1 family protein 1